jgi:hypothetical protein
VLGRFSKARHPYGREPSKAKKTLTGRGGALSKPFPIF